MLIDPATSADLKPWLVRTLEPICDAEPGALSDYILALLKHNVPEHEMRKELAMQLEEFLEKEGPPFIDTLFTVIRTKSYLPYATTSPVRSYSPPRSQSMDTGIPIPLDAALLSPTAPSSPARHLKRSLENDDRDGHPPAKGPRLTGDVRPKRYPNGRDIGDAQPIGVWRGSNDRKGRQSMSVHGQGDVNMGMGRGMNGSIGHTNGRHPQAYQPPDHKKNICRDYHNYGYCARGSLCRFSHGEDAVVPGQLFPMPGAPMAGAGLPFMPLFPSGPMPFSIAGPGGAYDPHEARMDMRPHMGGMGSGGHGAPRPPMMPRMMHGDGNMLMHKQGELPVIQDLTPDVTPYEQMEDNDQHNQGANGISQAQTNPSMDVEMGPVVPTLSTDTIGMGGIYRPGRPGRARGAFGADAQSVRPERRKDKTLVVEKIPEDKLTLEAINDWFRRFGTVTNVAVDPRNAKALVSFSEHHEAFAAWRSEDAVFNNRFVKLFWHRPMEGHGQTGTKMLAASAPLIANISAKETTTPANPSESSTLPSNTTKKSTTPRKATTATTAIAAKKELLERQIAEQKSLMASLETASSDKKKEIMARLRKLTQEMDAASAQTSSTATASAASDADHTMSEHERKERERLDRELDMHAASTDTEDKESLKMKLARLQAEAVSLGLPEAMGQPTYSAPFRPYRGRGRGSRSHFRGPMRGGHLPRAAMTLDNRPKKLIVRGVPGEGLQAIRDWYETTAQLESVERTEDDAIIATFRTRSGAEQGLAKGNNIPTVGQVSIAWLPSGPATRTTSSAPSISDGQADEKVGRGSPEPLPMQEDEVVASGWGGGPGDDGDGMGML